MNGLVDSQAEARRAVMAFEPLVREGIVVEPPITHHFAHKVYGREMFMQKGLRLIGKIHKYSQLNILSKGDVSVLLPGGVQRVQAGFHVVAPAGSQRIFYAHEDSIWTVIHGTDETDVGKIEEHFIAQSEAEFLEFCEQQRIASMKTIAVSV